MHSPKQRASNALVLLLQLRWTLLLRTYSRSHKNLFGLAITALVFGPISVFLAVLAYEFGHDSAQAALLISRAALTIIYGLWIAAPLLGFPLNESNDPSRLFVYPVPLRTILVAGVLGSVIEPATLLAVPVCVAVALLFCHSVFSAVIAFLAVGLFMLHTLAVAQLLLLSLIGLLRSRQFRDITIVLLPLVAVGAYVGQQVLASGMIGNAFGTISRLGVWRAADGLPPGWAVRACIDAAGGHLVSALVLVLALAAVVIIPFPLAAAALSRLYSGERGSMPSAARIPTAQLRRVPGAQTSPTAASAKFGGSDIAALGNKERIYLVREPQYKALAVNALYTMAVVLFGFGVGFGRHSGPANDLLRQAHGTYFAIGISFHLVDAVLVIRALLIPSLLLLATTQLVFNIFGGDGSAITVLLTFPTPRLRLILAKNLAYAPVLIALGLIGAAASVIFLHAADMLVIELAWVLAATLVIVGVGNLVSVRFPTRMIVRGQRFKSGSNVAYGGAQGCAYAYLQTLCYLGALAMLIPAAAAFIVPPTIGNEMLLWVTIPLALIYAGIIYWTATRWAASMLVRRETDMIAALVSDE